MFRALRPIASVRQAAMFRSGDAGAIRDAGGSFAKREQAAEEQYFRKQAAMATAQIRKSIKDHRESHNASKTAEPKKA